MKGFTLMEVNLAMFVMAVGTLGLVSLYSFGYRENQQSVEDVRGASVAEVNMNALIASLSSTNMTWTEWNSIGTLPANGWGKYAGDGTGVNWNDNGGGNDNQKIRPMSNPTSEARSVFSKIVKLGGGSGSFYDGNGLACGLVINQEGDRCSIAFRSGKRSGTLVYQPLYYTEVRFQGLRRPEEGGK